MYLGKIINKKDREGESTVKPTKNAAFLIVINQLENGFEEFNKMFEDSTDCACCCYSKRSNRENHGKK